VRGRLSEHQSGRGLQRGAQDELRKFFKGGSRLLAYLVKAEDVPTHDNRKSYVFIVALKDGQFAWEEVLTFNGDAIQAEISEGGETMVV
jgi:hypothetical protein